MALGAPKDWASTLVTAADLNTEIRDQFNLVYFVGEPWVAEPAPIWSSFSANTSVGSGGTLKARVRVFGKTLHFVIGLKLGTSPGLGSGVWYMELPSSWAPRNDPFAPLNAGRVSWSAVDVSSGNQYTGIAPRFGTRMYLKTSAQPVGDVHGTSPFSWAVNDELAVYGSYEIP